MQVIKIHTDYRFTSTPWLPEHLKRFSGQRTIAKKVNWEIFQKLMNTTFPGRTIKKLKKNKETLMFLVKSFQKTQSIEKTVYGQVRESE